MISDEMKIKISQLLDGEMDSVEKVGVYQQIFRSPELVKEFVAQYKLIDDLKSLEVPIPSEDWFSRLEQKPIHKGTRRLGFISVIGFSLFVLFNSFMVFLMTNTVSLSIKIGIAGIVGGIMILAVVTSIERVIESRHDRYKEVVK